LEIANFYVAAEVIYANCDGKKIELALPTILLGSPESLKAREEHDSLVH